MFCYFLVRNILSRNHTAVNGFFSFFEWGTGKGGAGYAFFVASLGFSKYNEFVQEDIVMIEVYYAEDDESIAKSVKEYLEQQDCKVVVFGGIADLRKALIGHLPSVLLLDWNMPDGEGNEFCQWIRERWRDLPVIYLTVRGDSHDIVTGFQNGADDYVVKPFDLAVLYSRILALLRRARNTKETKLFCDDLMLDKEKTAVYCQQEEIVVSQPEVVSLLLRQVSRRIRNKG